MFLFYNQKKLTTMNPQELTSSKIATMSNHELFKLAHGLKENMDLALNLYQTAANRGHANAQNTLGCFYRSGEAGLKKDVDTAKDWFLRSAEQGFFIAYYNLGQLYFDNKEYVNAIKWFTKISNKKGQVKSQSALQGQIQSNYMLGIIYYYGKGVDFNREKAFEFFTLASDNGHAHAQYYLGLLYYSGKGGKGMEVNIEKAVELFTLSATQSNAAAEYKLGEYYEFRKKNDTKALEFYRKGAEHGNAIAQCKLGYFYEYGKGGLERNLPVSKEWYLKSASQGLPVGQYHAGMLFKYKESNVKDAEEWFTKAAQQGYSNAFFELGRIEMNEKHNKERASFFFIEALNSTNRANQICILSIQSLVVIAQQFEIKHKDKAIEIYIVLLQYHGLDRKFDSIVKKRLSLLYEKTR